VFGRVNFHCAADTRRSRLLNLHGIRRGVGDDDVLKRRRCMNELLAEHGRAENDATENEQKHRYKCLAHPLSSLSWLCASACVLEPRALRTTPLSPHTRGAPLLEIVFEEFEAPSAARLGSIAQLGRLRCLSCDAPRPTRPDPIEAGTGQ